jgi:hypothetical protein
MLVYIVFLCLRLASQFSWLCMIHSSPIVQIMQFRLNCWGSYASFSVFPTKRLALSAAFPLRSGTSHTRSPGCIRSLPSICIAAETPSTRPMWPPIPSFRARSSPCPQPDHSTDGSCGDPGHRGRVRWSPVVSHSHSRTSLHSLPVPFPTRAFPAAPLLTPYCAEPLDKTLQPGVSWLGPMPLCRSPAFASLRPEKTPLPPQQIVMPGGKSQRVWASPGPSTDNSHSLPKRWSFCFSPVSLARAGECRAPRRMLRTLRSLLFPSSRPCQWRPPPIRGSSSPRVEPGPQNTFFRTAFQMLPSSAIHSEPSKSLTAPFSPKTGIGSRRGPGKANPPTNCEVGIQEPVQALHVLHTKR